MAGFNLFGRDTGRGGFGGFGGFGAQKLVEPPETGGARYSRTTLLLTPRAPPNSASHSRSRIMKAD